MALEIIAVVSLVANVTMAYFLLRRPAAKIKETQPWTDKVMKQSGGRLIPKARQAPGVYYNDGGTKDDDDRRAATDISNWDNW